MFLVKFYFTRKFFTSGTYCMNPDNSIITFSEYLIVKTQFPWIASSKLNLLLRIFLWETFSVFLINVIIWLLSFQLKFRFIFLYGKHFIIFSIRALFEISSKVFDIELSIVTGSRVRLPDLHFYGGVSTFLLISPLFRWKRGAFLHFFSKMYWNSNYT
jgi:hypothetical protein